MRLGTKDALQEYLGHLIARYPIRLEALRQRVERDRLLVPELWQSRRWDEEAEVVHAIIVLEQDHQHVQQLVDEERWSMHLEVEPAIWRHSPSPYVDARESAAPEVMN